jgi:hypothetical protein
MFFIGSSTYDSHLKMVNCRVPYEAFWENYLADYRPHLLQLIPYTPYLLPLYEVNHFHVKNN